jgi:chemotaxis protein histidine kinase CheA
VDRDEQWMQWEGQLVQLAGELRARRARMRRLQEALDDTRGELGRLERDVLHLQAARPPGEAAPTRGRDAHAVLLVRQGATLEALAEQLRELVALHRVFRELSRMLREVSGNHEVRLRALERQLLIGTPPSVH